MQEVVTRVKRQFGDEAGVQISDLDIIRWINDAQEEIGRTNQGLMETTGSADIVANQAEYDMPADFSVLRSLRYKGFRLKAMTLAEFNEYLDGYAVATGGPYGPGTPEVFTVWENKITLFPTPNETITAGLSVFYIKHPASVANLADDLSLPIKYHNTIVTYCLQQAYELDEDFQKAQLKEGKFNKDLMQLNDNNKWVSQEYYPRITTLPEDENYGGFGYFGGYT